MNLVDINGQKAMTTGGLSEYIGMPVTRKLLDGLGCVPFHTEKAGNACFWSVKQVPEIIGKMIEHLEALRS